MTDITNSGLNDRENYLDTDNDKTQDSSNSDAAKFNTDEQEQFVNERMETEDATAQDMEADTTPVINQQPLTTQGDITEVEENMGGTTNLTLDQLKKEGDPEGMDGE